MSLSVTFAPYLPVVEISKEDPASGEGIVLLEIRCCFANATRPRAS